MKMHSLLDFWTVDHPDLVISTSHVCHCIGAPYEPLKEVEFAAGDSVKVELDPDVWKLMQNGHGGWNDLMSMVRLSVHV